MNLSNDDKRLIVTLTYNDLLSLKKEGEDLSDYQAWFDLIDKIDYNEPTLHTHYQKLLEQ